MSHWTISCLSSLVDHALVGAPGAAPVVDYRGILPSICDLHAVAGVGVINGVSTNSETPVKRMLTLHAYAQDILFPIARLLGGVNETRRGLPLTLSGEPFGADTW